MILNDLNTGTANAQWQGGNKLPSLQPELPAPQKSTLMEGAYLLDEQYESLDKLESYLGTLPWDDDSKNHNKAHKAFLRCAYLGIEPRVGLERVQRRIFKAGGIVDPSDLERQVQRAYDYVNS